MPHGSVQVSTLNKSSSAAVLATSLDRSRPHGFVQVLTLNKSSSAAVLAASLDRSRPHGSVQVSTLNKSSSVAVLAASLGLVRAAWVCASFNFKQVIFSCSTCCLFGPARALWV